MGTIRNLELVNNSTVKFVWRIVFVNGHWNQHSEMFAIDKMKRQCVISIKTQDSNPKEMKYVRFEITFDETYTFYMNRKFELTVYFDSYTNGYSFLLYKKNDSGQSSRSFISDYQFIYSSKWIGYSYIDLTVILVCLKRDTVQTLLKDIKELLNEDNGDLKIISKDRVFNVHKCILSVRSIVFNKMIHSDMIEKKTGEINLKDWDSAVIKELLNFIYTGDCDVEKVPHDLFRLAHFLELQELQQLCLEYLENINFENIVPTLELTNLNLFELEKLRELADRFVSDNKAKLSEKPEYIEYLKNSMNLNNFMEIVHFAQTYKFENLLLQAMEFVRVNYKKILKNPDCKSFFRYNFEFFCKVFEYSLDTKDEHSQTLDLTTFNK